MAENGSRGARRCLFGREDHDTLDADLTEQVKQEEKKSAEAFEKKWNFKIEDETPLPGRYKWEKFDKTTTEQSTSRSLSHLPSLESTTNTSSEEVVEITVKSPSIEISDTEKTSSDERCALSSSTLSDSDVGKASSSSLSSDEKDINQNIVHDNPKRKAPSTPCMDKILRSEAKRTKPP